MTDYFGTNQESYQPRDRPTYQLKEDLSYSRGRHMIKLGGEYRLSKDFRTAGPAIDGTFTFNGQYSGNAFADFLLGRVSSMTQGSVRQNDGRSRAGSLYVQDDWQLRPKLTLSAGLRWDPFLAFYDVIQPQPVFRPGQPPRRLTKRSPEGDSENRAVFDAAKGKDLIVLESEPARRVATLRRRAGNESRCFPIRGGR